MPIYYNDKKVELKNNIIADLELIDTFDASCNTIYSFCFNNDNDISEKITEQMAKYYTTDINFLKDNQKLIKEYVSLETTYTNISANYKKIIDIWNEIKIDYGFREKYYYIDWEMIEFLNKSELFLQFMSIYNLFSPLLSLIAPIIILIIPFVILKLKGLQISVGEYIDVLKIIAQSNALGKLFTSNLSEKSIQENIYIFVSAAFYIFSIYQNIMVCIRFNENMKVIHDHFREIEIYLNSTLNSMNNYLKYTENLTSHEQFNTNLKNKMVILENIKNKI
jgi:hypothetical protein